jgi:hypothetical protein
LTKHTPSSAGLLLRGALLASIGECIDAHIDVDIMATIAELRFVTGRARDTRSALRRVDSNLKSQKTRHETQIIG